MAFEHTETGWSEWLKTVQAGRPPNIKVTGQPVADELVGTVAIATAAHLADPLGWIQVGHQFVDAGALARFGLAEIIAVVPFWLEGWFSDTDDVELAVLDVPALAGHVAPATIFSGVPSTLVQVGNELLGPAADAMCLRAGDLAAARPVAAGLRIFIPQGKVLQMWGTVSNQAIRFSCLWQEIPRTR